MYLVPGPCDSVPQTNRNMTDAHEQILRRFLAKIAEEQQYENHSLQVIPIPSEGTNYTTVLFRVVMTAPDKQDLKLFAKVAAVGEKFRSQMMTRIFDVEHFSYTKLASIYNRLQDKYQVPKEDRLVMPKFYGYHGTYLEETLVLQDLSAEGYIIHDRLQSMGWEYAAKALEELAKLHGLSIAFQEEYPEEFEQTAKLLKIQTLDPNAMPDFMEQMKSKTIEACDEEFRERVEGLFQKFGEEEFVSSFYGPQKRPVLVHGDFKMSNIMHRQRGSHIDLIPLDYQCVHVGAGIRDVLFFLLSGTDGDFRGKHFHRLLDHYYEQVCTTLERLHQEPGKVFPREDYDYEVKRNLPCSVVVAMFILPVVTVATEDAPKVDGELGISGLVDVKGSDLYQARIRELVRDCADWGVI